MSEGRGAFSDSLIPFDPLVGGRPSASSEDCACRCHTERRGPLCHAIGVTRQMPGVWGRGPKSSVGRDLRITTFRRARPRLNVVGKPGSSAGRSVAGNGGTEEPRPPLHCVSASLRENNVQTVFFKSVSRRDAVTQGKNGAGGESGDVKGNERVQVHFQRDVLLLPLPLSLSSLSREEDHRQAPRTPLADATRSRGTRSAVPLAQSGAVGVGCGGGLGVVLGAGLGGEGGDRLGRIVPGSTPAIRRAGPHGEQGGCREGDRIDRPQVLIQVQCRTM